MIGRIRLIAALTAFSAAASAQDAPDPLLPDADRAVVELQRGLWLSFPGSVRMIYGDVGGAQVAPEEPGAPEKYKNDTFLYTRARLTPALTINSRGFFKLFKLVADAEVHSFDAMGNRPVGQEQDPRWDFRESSPDYRLTQAYGLVLSRWGQIKVGLIRNQFGLGAVSNAGNDAKRGSVRNSPFGYGRQGDRALHAEVAFFPFKPKISGGKPKPPLVLLAFAERIEDDDTIRSNRGDTGWQAGGGVQVEMGGALGIVGVTQRHQEYTEGGETDVAILSVVGRYDILKRHHKLYVEGEYAAYAGETTFLESSLRPGAYSVLATGGLARVVGGTNRYEYAVEGGMASGDSNPFDNDVRTFNFDREHRVGMLMFGEALRQTTAVSASNIADPTYRENPPRGFNRLATGGTVQNTLYLNPRMAVNAYGATLTLGYVRAVAEEPYADAFRTGVAGGEPTAHRGAKQKTDLGQEFDVGLEYNLDIPGARLHARVEFAYFKPGDVFDTADGEAMDAMTGMWTYGGVRW